MTPVFADTFYWIALFSPEDAAHRMVTAYSRGLSSTPVVTTDEVLTEVPAACAADSYMRAKAVQNVYQLLAYRHVRVVSRGRLGFLKGLELYQARADKGYSLVDCISMQLMRQEGLTEALTGDRHFEQEGFRAVFRV